MDPASDPSRPRWRYGPTTVPNASQWDVVLDARSPSEFEEDRMLGALSTPVLDDEERADNREVGGRVVNLAITVDGNEDLGVIKTICNNIII